MDKSKTSGIIKYISGLIGFMGLLLAILTVTGAMDWILTKVNYQGQLTDQNKLVISLVAAIVGVFLLFIAFSAQLDKFFTFIGTHKIKGSKKAETKGVTIETVFFLFITVVLVVLINLLGVNALVLKSNLPLLGKSTKAVLMILLIVLALFSLYTAFHKTILLSVKEMKKVHWPTGKEMTEYSKRVFSFIIFFMVFFFLLDFLLHFFPFIGK